MTELSPLTQVGIGAAMVAAVLLVTYLAPKHDPKDHDPLRR